MFAPSGFFQSQAPRNCTRIIFGKTRAPPGETPKLKQLTPSRSFGQDFNVYVFDYGSYGPVGVSICYGFMNVERALMYRGKIQYLIVFGLSTKRKVKFVAIGQLRQLEKVHSVR